MRVHAAVRAPAETGPRRCRISIRWRDAGAGPAVTPAHSIGCLPLATMELPMSKRFAFLTAAAIIALTSGAVCPVSAEMEQMVNVGGAPMYPSRYIIQNAVSSKYHTT